MIDVSLTPSDRDFQSPPWWLWPLAGIAGLIVAAGSLNYAPEGRINVLWLWVLWAGLPFLGAVISVLYLLFGRARPWLFRWRARTVYWYPSAEQRLRMLFWLQCFWLLVGLGILLGFWLLLLLTDLAFGWSSTLLSDEHWLLSSLQAIAFPWQAICPEAVPDARLMEATRYVRIDPSENAGSRAGDWWPFMMASLIFYNLLPRSVLAAMTYLRLHWVMCRAPGVQVAGVSGDASAQATDLAEAPLRDWQQVPALLWERPQDTSYVSHAFGHTFGEGAWEADEQALEQVLLSGPARLLWRVNAYRSPVAELGDLISRARRSGVQEQGLLAVADTAAIQQRHIASWQRFCQRQNLTWVVN